MNQNEFTVVLPSNSSMKYFPNNTTTNYSTRLPREVELYGKWLVGISEIHIPCTTLHLRPIDTRLTDPNTKSQAHYFQYGTYDSIKSLVQAINEALILYRGEDGEKFFYDDKGGFVSIRGIKKVQSQQDEETQDPVFFSDTLKRILGFEDGGKIRPVPSKEKKIIRDMMLVGDLPASLARAIPDQLFIYSNLCEPCIVGDAHAPLLRIVSLDAREFNFGSTIVKKFAPVTYVPLLSNRFQTIDIDIRDQFGKPIPFEFGTLTAALHFKRQF